MNLHAMASAGTSIITPFIPATVMVNTGYTTSDDGTRVPEYNESNVSIQSHAAKADMIKYLNNLGWQGVFRNVYINGDYQGINVACQTGGDMFRFSGYEWLVAHVIESWPGWSHFIVCRQNTVVESEY